MAHRFRPGYPSGVARLPSALLAFCTACGSGQAADPGAEICGDVNRPDIVPDTSKIEWSTDWPSGVTGSVQAVSASETELLVGGATFRRVAGQPGALPYLGRVAVSDGSELAHEVLEGDGVFSALSTHGGGVVLAGQVDSHLRLGDVDIPSGDFVASLDRDTTRQLWLDMWAKGSRPLAVAAVDGDTYSVATVESTRSVEVVRHDSDGAPQWTFSVDVGSVLSGGSFVHEAITLVPDGVIVAGTLDGTVTSGGEVVSAAGESYDVFLLRLASTGDIVWQRSFGGAGDETLVELATDSTSGDVFLIASGEREPPPDLGVGEIQYCGGSILARYDGATGDPIWSVPHRFLDLRSLVVVNGEAIGGGRVFPGNLRRGDGIVLGVDRDGRTSWHQRLQVGSGEGAILVSQVVAVDDASAVLAGEFQGGLKFAESGTGDGVFFARLSIDGA